MAAIVWLTGTLVSISVIVAINDRKSVKDISIVKATDDAVLLVLRGEKISEPIDSYGPL